MLRALPFLLAWVALAHAQSAPSACDFGKLLRATILADQLLSESNAEPLRDSATELPEALPPLLPPVQPGVELSDAERLQRLTYLSLYSHAPSRISDRCTFFPKPWLVPDEPEASEGRNQNTIYNEPGVYCWNGQRLEALSVPVRGSTGARASPVRQSTQRLEKLREFNQLARLCGALSASHKEPE